jgi:CRP-like cAMP-binding protein
VSGSHLQALQFGNRLLRQVQAPDDLEISRFLDRIDLQRGETLFEPGDSVEQVYFPCEGTIISLMITTSSGHSVEVASIGCEGAAGGIVSRGLLPAFTHAVVKLGGPSLRISVQRLQQLKSASPSLRNLITRYGDCLLAQVLQLVACNALHPLEARCARWLLTVQERLAANELPLTQEELAGSLGVQRSYASRVLQQLQMEGLIRTTRGRITIVDRDRLMRHSCECYSAVRDHFDRVLAGVYPGDRNSEDAL